MPRPPSWAWVAPGCSPALRTRAIGRNRWKPAPAPDAWTSVSGSRRSRLPAHPHRSTAVRPGGEARRENRRPGAPSSDARRPLVGDGARHELRRTGVPHTIRRHLAQGSDDADSGTVETASYMVALWYALPRGQLPDRRPRGRCHLCRVGRVTAAGRSPRRIMASVCLPAIVAFVCAVCGGTTPSAAPSTTAAPAPPTTTPTSTATLGHGTDAATDLGGTGRAVRHRGRGGRPGARHLCPEAGQRRATGPADGRLGVLRTPRARRGGRQRTGL